MLGKMHIHIWTGNVDLIKNIKKAISILKGNDDKLNTSISNLTDSNTIKYVKLVNTLPADAASHPDTVYLIKS